MRREIIAITIFLMTGLSLISQYTYAIPDGPTEPHPANSMWVEPSVIDAGSYSLGDRFNVTVWVNVTVDCAGWQFAMLYDTRYLNATRAGYTGSDGTTSQFFEQSGTASMMPLTPDLDGPYNDTHKYVLHGEAWSPTVSNNPYATGTGSLSWIEFQIIAQPPFTTTLDIETLYPAKTYVSDPAGTKIELNLHNVEVVPEFPSSWILLLLLTISFFITTLIAKKKNK